MIKLLTMPLLNTDHMLTHPSVWHGAHKILNYYTIMEYKSDTCKTVTLSLIHEVEELRAKGIAATYLCSTQNDTSSNNQRTVQSQRRLDTYAAHVIVHWTRSDSAHVIACFTFLPQQPRSHVNLVIPSTLKPAL